MFTASPGRSPRVFRAWTEAADLYRWFAPADDYGIRIAELDLRPGGRYHFEMTAKNGEQFQVSGTYREIHPPERLVFTWRWQGWGKEQEDSLVTIQFLERSRRSAIKSTFSASCTGT